MIINKYKYYRCCMTLLFAGLCFAFLGQNRIQAQCTLSDPDGSPPGILQCPGSSQMAFCLNEGANWCYNAKHIYVQTTSSNPGPPPAPPLLNPCAISVIMGYENQGVVPSLTAQQAIWIVQGEPPGNYPPAANTLANAAIAGCASGLSLSNSSYVCAGGSGSGTLMFSVDVNTALPYVHLQFFEIINCLNGTGTVDVSVIGASLDPSTNWITNTGGGFTVNIILDTTSSPGASCFVGAYEHGGLLSFGYPDLADGVQYWWDDDTNDPDQPFCQYLGTWIGSMTYYSTFPNTDPLGPCPLCVVDVISSCNDGGTPTDPNDDYIEFELVLLGLTTPGNEQTVVSGTDVPYQALDLPPAFMPTFITAAVPGNGDIFAQIQYSSASSPYHTCSDSYTIPDPGSCSVAACTSSVTAAPGSCAPATNTYSVSGQITFSNPPATGTMTVADGSTTQVFNAPFTSPQAYTLNGITADGATHTVTVTFSADSGCGSSATYTAPAACTPASCTSSVTAMPGSCAPATNTYSVSGQITFSNPPATGTMTVADGSTTQVFNAPFTSPQAYTLNGITADGATHTVTVTFSADSGCGSSATYTAPAACTPASCTSSVTAMPGSCAPATNTYSVSGQITFSNPPATGTMTVADGSTTQVFNAPFTSPQAYTLNGITADGATHTVTVTFSADGGCGSSQQYMAPDPCSAQGCNFSVSNGLPTCNGSTYDITATLNWSGTPPTDGTVTFDIDGGNSQIYNTPFSSTMSHTFTGLNPDGAQHTINVTYDDGRGGRCTESLIYTAPASCTASCSIQITDLKLNPCVGSVYSLEVTVTYSNPPTGNIDVIVDGTSYVFTPSGSGSDMFLVTGLPGNGTPNIDVTTYFINDTGCRHTITGAYDAPDCNCPTVNPPANPNDPTICEGATTPALTVTVGAGETADWYAAASGGAALASGTTSYTPSDTAPGGYTYYAEARNTTDGCVSSTRTPVVLTINANPTLTLVGTTCSGDLSTYTIDFASNGTVTSTAGTVSGNQVTDIPTGTNVTLTSTLNACTTILAVNSPTCTANCPPMRCTPITVTKP